MKTGQDMKALHSGDYVLRFVKGQSPRRISNLVDLMMLDERAIVADFGCGSGLLMPYVAGRVSSYAGVDFSPDFIEQANRNKEASRFENVSFHCSSIEEFCREHEGMLDVAFALDFSEHVHDEEWLDVLRAIRRSLKPDGILYLHTPNGRFFLEIMKRHDFLIKQFPEHVAVRNVEENVALLEAAGFAIGFIKMLPHYNILKYLHFLSPVPLLGKYFQARIFIEARNAAGSKAGSREFST